MKFRFSNLNCRQNSKFSEVEIDDDLGIPVDGNVEIDDDLGIPVSFSSKFSVNGSDEDFTLYQIDSVDQLKRITPSSKAIRLFNALDKYSIPEEISRDELEKDQRFYTNINIGALSTKVVIKPRNSIFPSDVPFVDVKLFNGYASGEGTDNVIFTRIYALNYGTYYKEPSSIVENDLVKLINDNLATEIGNRRLNLYIPDGTRTQKGLLFCYICYCVGYWYCWPTFFDTSSRPVKPGSVNSDPNKGLDKISIHATSSTGADKDKRLLNTIIHLKL